MPRKPLNIPKEVLIQKYLTEQMNLRQIAEIFNTDCSTIKRYLQLYNIELRKPRSKKPSMWMSDINISKDYLYQKYILERLPINTISRELGVDRYFIREFLKKYNISSRGKNESHRYGFDEVFFSIPSNLNSYWAGFIAADGCILQHRSVNMLQVILNIKDLEHIKIFKKDIKFGGNIRIKTYKNRSKLPRMKAKEFTDCGITISSNILCDDLLINYNITHRKSLTLKPPNIENNENIMSFIAGYIDGDGCITIAKRKDRRYPNLSILGTYELLNWISQQLYRILNLKRIPKIYERMGAKNKYYILSLNRTADVLCLYNYIKKLNIPIMARKWDKLISMKVKIN